MNTIQEKVNVASKVSQNGHFAKGARNVVMLDDVTETSLIEGPATLETHNHTTLNIEDDCIVTIQTVYNPFTQIMEKVKD